MSAAEDEATRRPKERAALDKLRQAVGDLSIPSTEDWYLLKWLRARKFNADDAEKMLREHVAWRKKYDVDNILDDYQAPAVLKEYFPGGFVECSPDGRPVLISPTGYADFKGLVEAAPRADLLLFCIYLLESAEELKRRLSLENGRRIETMYVVADMDNFSFWNFSSLEVVTLATEVVRMYEDNYPEILQEVFIVNAPSVFPLLWNIIKPLLTQRTIDKIHIFGRDGWREILAERWDVEKLPAHWGGRLTGPDGDARCKHLIVSGGPVPEKYRRRWSHDGAIQQYTIGPGCRLTLPVPVMQAGSELRWRFGTTSGEVAFAVRYRQPTTCHAEIRVGDEEVQDLIALRRLAFSRHAPHSGSLLCREAGSYELVFDNTFSSLARKELSYTVELLPPTGEATQAIQKTGLPVDARTLTEVSQLDSHINVSTPFDSDIG